MRLHEITPEIIQKFIRDSTLKPKTTKNLIGDLKGLWKTARAWGYVTHNPFDGLRLSKVEKADVAIFTLEEVQKLIAAADEPHRTLYYLAASTGMRAGELCGLRIGDVRFDSLQIMVVQSSWNGKIQSPKSANAIRANLNWTEAGTNATRNGG
jgi:integrase